MFITVGYLKSQINKLAGQATYLIQLRNGKALPVVDLTVDTPQLNSRVYFETGPTKRIWQKFIKGIDDGIEKSDAAYIQPERLFASFRRRLTQDRAHSVLARVLRKQDDVCVEIRKYSQEMIPGKSAAADPENTYNLHSPRVEIKVPETSTKQGQELALVQIKAREFSLEQSVRLVNILLNQKENAPATAFALRALELVDDILKSLPQLADEKAQGEIRHRVEAHQFALEGMLAYIEKLDDGE